jgi:hypothetical protein
MASASTDTAKIVRKFALDKGFYIKEKGVIPNWASELYEYGNKDGVTQEEINAFMKVFRSLPYSLCILLTNNMLFL